LFKDEMKSYVFPALLLAGFGY